MNRTDDERRRRAVIADAAAGLGDTPELSRPLTFPDPVRALLRCDCGELFIEGDEHDCPDADPSGEAER
jgi:hypothetical protein